MLSSARSCASENLTRLRPRKVDIAATPEPLLFLYPQWFQTGAYRIRGRYSSTSAHAQKIDRHVYGHRLTELPDIGPAGKDGSTTLFPQSATTKAVRTPEQRLLNLNNIASRQASSDLVKQPPRDEAKLSQSIPKRARDYNPSQIDGLALARKLASIANASPGQSSDETMQFNRQFLKWYSGTSNQNMWFHREHSGCRIYVLPHSESDHDRRDVVLVGSERSRQLARSHLLALNDDFTAQQNEGCSTTEVQQSTAGLLDVDVDSNIRYVHVNRVPTPVKWTIGSFYSYVKAILAQQAPRTIERSLYRAEASFDKSASQLLMETFRSETLSQYQSIAALRLVLDHFRHRTQAAANIVSIWTSVIENGLVPDTDCFNLEISRSIRVNNVERVEYLLWNMRLFHLKPDAGTWAVLLGTLHNTAERKNLISALLRRNHLSTPQDKNIITRALIVAEFRHVVTQEDGIPKFAGWLQKKLGVDWLSPGAVCDMIEQCIQSTEPWKVHEILDLARYFGINIDQLDNTALLDIIRRTKHFSDTVWFFKSVHPSHDHFKAQPQIDLLFKLAWKKKLFNTCRLIWAYAASRGLISQSMQRLVVNNLAMNHNSSSTSQRFHPDPCLAAVTIGTNTVIDDFSTRFPLLAKHGSTANPAELLCQWMPNDGRRHEQMQLSHLLLERDLNAAAVFRPMRYTSFIAGLRTVYEMDLQWKRNCFLDKATISEVLADCMKVGLRHRACKKLAGQPTAGEFGVANAEEIVDYEAQSTASLSAENNTYQRHSASTNSPPSQTRDECRAQESAALSLACTTAPTYACALTSSQVGVTSLELLLQYLGRALNADSISKPL